jgi:predicted phosphohydrolase
MDVFGPNWKDHDQKIRRYWQAAVKPDDVVLVPGDISWALRLEEAIPDLEFVGSLPGRKLMLKGNHDYWWKSLSKVRASLPAGCEALQNDFVDAGFAVIAGTRGWLLPGSDFFVEGRDETAFEREVERLSLSLSAAAANAGGRPMVVMMHFPPSEDGRPTPFTERISASGAGLCVYGHLHGPAWPSCTDFDIDGVGYRLVSADWLDFRPLELRVEG